MEARTVPTGKAASLSSFLETKEKGKNIIITLQFLCYFTHHLYLNALNTTFHLGTGSSGRIFNNILGTHFFNEKNLY